MGPVDNTADRFVSTPLSINLSFFQIDALLNVLLRLLEHSQTKDRQMNLLGESSVAVNFYTLLVKPLSEVCANSKRKTLKVGEHLVSSLFLQLPHLSIS